MIVPRENAIDLPWTVGLYARNDKGARGWWSEQDVRLDLAYWDNGEDCSERYGYELRGVWTDAGYVTAQSDALAFRLICDGLEHDHKLIMEKLLEIEPGISSPRLEAAE